MSLSLDRSFWEDDSTGKAFYVFILKRVILSPDSRKKTVYSLTGLNDFVRCSALCREQLSESLVPLQM